MQMDRYSKFVLTIIAAAPMIIAVGQLGPGSVVAQSGYLNGTPVTCGDISRPCYVTSSLSDPVTVRFEFMLANDGQRNSAAGVRLFEGERTWGLPVVVINQP